MALWEYLGAGSWTTKLLLHLNQNATDSSWNWNNWEPTNIIWTWWMVWSWSASFSWDGTIAINNKVINNSSFSISFWIKTWTHWAWINTCIIDNTWFSWFNRWVIIWQFSWNLHKLYTRIMEWSNNFWNTLVSNTNIDDNIWHHIVYTYTNDTSTNWINLYIDWNLDNQKTAISSMWVATNNLYFWRSSDTAQYYFKWTKDEIIIELWKIWSATDAKKHYTYSKWLYWIL